jgi:hypothetical protein
VKRSGEGFSQSGSILCETVTVLAGGPFEMSGEFDEE